MPYRLDLKYSAAFFMISQGKIEEAIKVYQQISETYVQAFNAKILEAVYTKVLKGNEVYEEQMEKYEELYPGKVEIFRETVKKAELGLRRINF